MNESPDNIFTQWLCRPVSGQYLRLVIEQMNDTAPAPAVGHATVSTDAQVSLQVTHAGQEVTWPWQADTNDPAPAITWSADVPLEFKALEITQYSETQWIRRYRVEVSHDGHTWTVATPSRLIDCVHRQPAAPLRNHVEILHSSLLPEMTGTDWSSSFFEDFMLRALAPLGPDSNYPSWVPGPYLISCAAAPFHFAGVYNAGDCANFNTLIAAVLCPDIAIDASTLFPAIIDRFGFMPGVMNVNLKDDRAFSLDYSQQTWGPCCYADTFAWAGARGKEFLEPFANACAKWAKWWFDNRDRNQDGWLEPGVNNCEPADDEYKQKMARNCTAETAQRCPEFWDYRCIHNPDMPALQAAIFEAPWDDWPVIVRGRSRNVRFDPETMSVNIHYIESQLYIALLCNFTDQAYRRLGRPAEAVEFSEQAERLKALVRDHCWDEATGFYYDRDIKTKQLITEVKHLGAFVAMMMGLPTMQQAQRMVDHLTNPAEFWTDYPAPTISRDSVDYSPSNYWSGRAWPPTNFFVLRALLNYGFFDVADEFLRRWMKHTQSCVDRPVQCIEGMEQLGLIDDRRCVHLADVQWIVPENWNPETGQVHGSGGLVWGGLWLPALIMRHFWPIDDHRVLLRPGGKFRLKWSDRYDISIDNKWAKVNGCSYRMSDSATYILDTNNSTLKPLQPGRADPVCLHIE